MNKNIQNSIRAFILTVALFCVYAYLAVQIGDLNIYKLASREWKTLLDSLVVAALAIHVVLYILGYEIEKKNIERVDENESKAPDQNLVGLIRGRADRWAFDILTFGLISWLVLLINPSFSEFISRYFYHLIVATIFVSFFIKYGVEIFYFYRVNDGGFFNEKNKALGLSLTIKNFRYKKLFFLLIFFIIDIPIFLLLKPVFLWNFGWQVQAALENVPVQTQAYKKIDDQLVNLFIQHIKELQENTGSPAMSVAIAKNGQLVWAGARGYSNYETQKPVNLSTRFRTGSVAKPLTAVAAARLVAKGILDLDKSIYDYGVNYSDPDTPISARQLLSHMGGVRNYGLCFCFPIWEYYSDDHYETVAETLEVTKNNPLMFTPGTDFSYSTYGYNLLAAALEATTSKFFLDIVSEEVLKPLSMSDTNAEGFNADNVVTFYVRNGESIKEAIQVDNSNKWAGGGFLTTPADLVRLGVGFLDESFLDKGTREIFLTPQRLSTGEINHQQYALGFRVKTSARNSQQLIHHGGTGVGSTAFLLIRPIDKTVIAIMSNVEQDSSAALGESAEKIIALIDASSSLTE